MRTPLIAGNWKMYKTSSEARETAARLVDLAADVDDVDIMIAPTFTALESVSGVTKNSRVSVGGQDLFWEKEGAYTGQISADMLVGVGCQYVIIGHSERRQYFGETDEWVNNKTKAAIGNGLIPIVCVGESLEQREENITMRVIEKQVRGALDGIGLDEIREELTKDIRAVFIVWFGATLTIFIYEGPVISRAFMPTED